MVKWSCASSLCFNNYSSVFEKPWLTGYRLPRKVHLKNAYCKLFKTQGMNFKSGFICSEHWSDNVRVNTEHLPDVIVPSSQLEKLKTKLDNARQKLRKNPPKSERKKFRILQKKYQTAISITSANNSNTDSSLPRPVLSHRRILVRHSPKKKASSPRKRKPKQKPLTDAEKWAIEKNQLEDTIKKQSAKIASLESTVLNLEGKLFYVERNSFKFSNLKTKPKMFYMLCGLELEQFRIIFDCIQPYLRLLETDLHTPSFGDRETQLLSVLTIFRHGLQFNLMAFILGTSVTTMQRISNSWTLFLSTVLNRIDLTPDHGFLLEKMPKSFIDTGHGLTDLVLDATEFKFNFATNYDVNSLMFSHYKNHSTGKALIGIAPHGMGIVFSEIYPGSISDTEITEKTDVLKFVQEDHEIMTDRGFSIQDLCAEKGVALNRPKQKENDQFSSIETQRNFDIASTRIHVERFIGRVRNWKILNEIWPLNRIDMLTSTWQTICHVVNLTCPPIGPKN